MDFKVGFAEDIITPEINLPMGGYSARKGNAIGIHDDLFARAAYFNFQNRESIIISADVLSFPLKIIKFYQKIIAKNVGIPSNRILICALHNHSGPDTIGLTHPFHGFFVSNLNKQIFLDMGRQFIKIANQAKKAQQHAIIGAEKTIMEKRLIINRREPLKDSKYNVSVIKFTDKVDNLIGLIINYACHATVLPSDNLLYSADYPGYIIKRIHHRLGESTPVIYLNGPCGDLNPNLFDFNVSLRELDLKKAILYDGPGHAKGTFQRAKEIGFAIADKAVELSNSINCSPITDFKHIVKSYLFKMKSLLLGTSFHDITKHLRYKFKLKLLQAFWWVNKTEIPYPLDYIYKNGKYFQQFEIHGIQLNDIVILGLPGEMFSELGDRILERSPFNTTIIVGLANGYLGYLYPLDAFKKGGYELFLSTNPLLGSYLTNKTIELLNLLK